MNEKYIPGTVLDYDGISADVFDLFRPMIKATDGLSLGQICAVTGLETSTVQNWVKRGFVAHPQKKKYYERQFARILLISALRESMQIDRIGELMEIINGDTERDDDDIISEPELYDRFCSAVRNLSHWDASEKEITTAIINSLNGYESPDRFTFDKLRLALTVMVTAYISGLIKKESENYYSLLCNKK